MAIAKVKNTTSFSRTGVVTLGIPFSRGDNIQSSDTFVVSGALTGNDNQLVQWYPAGARWDNGAIKYIRASFKTDLTSSQEKTVTISKSSSYTAIPFNVDSGLVTGFLGTLFEFNIQGRLYTIPMMNVISNPIEGGGANDHYSRYRYFTHLPDVTLDPQYKYFWVDLMVETHSGLNTLEFYFRFGYYRFYPGLPNASGVDTRVTLNQNVTLRIVGPTQKIRWEEYKIPSIVSTSSTNKLYTLINTAVPGKNVMVAGQSHCYKGVLCYDASSSASANLQEPILAMAQDWKTFYPITGVMPANPPYITSEANALTRSNTLLNLLQNPVKAITDPYNWPTLCNNPSTSGAGTHGYRDYAYGLRGWPVLSTANYNWIPFLEFSTRQQATRGNWFYTTAGAPIPPNTLLSAGVRIWNGSFHSSGNGEQFAGFNRIIADWDPPTAAPSGGTIYGPDKEHFTNKMFIIQGFITMDWFSLEYAKMYSKYWVYANRTDNYGGYPSNIDTFGASRAAGRTSEVAAFLYEFYADSELKTWMKTRLNYNLSQSFAALLNKSINPGGTEVIRAVNISTPCGQAACLNSLTHWRPWEEAQAVLGFYLIAKAILTETPTDTDGLKYLSLSRDIAASVLLYGYIDARPASSSRRVLSLSFPNAVALGNYMTGIGVLPTTITARGTTTNAIGTIYMYSNDFDYGGLYTTTLKLYLKNATGTFTPGEQIRLSTGLEAPLLRTWNFAGGCKSRALTSPTNGYARNLTATEEEAVGVPGEDANYAPPFYPAGYFKYNYYYYLYEMVQIQSAVVAREAAILGYYSNNNSAVISWANDLLTYYNSSGYNSDNGDFEEGFLCFAGYLVPNLVNTSQISITTIPVVSQGSIPTPSTSVSNTQVNVICTPIACSTATEISIPSVTTSTVANSIVTALPTFCAAEQPAPSASAGASVSVSNAVSTEFSIPAVDNVYTSTYTIGKKVFTYIYLGEPESIPSYTDNPNEVIGEIPLGPPEGAVPLIVVYTE